MFKKNILKELSIRLKNLTLTGKSSKVSFLFLLLGLLFVLISNIFSNGRNNSNKKLETTNTQESYTSVNNYKKDLESSVKDIISAMKDVGENPKVLISLESTEQNVYATENKKSTETIKDGYSNYTGSYYSTGEQNKVKETSETETKYIKIRDSDGTEKALAVTKIQPAIKGVVVVCPGGGDPLVKDKITDAVKVALNIPSRKVFVTK